MTPGFSSAPSQYLTTPAREVARRRPAPGYLGYDSKTADDLAAAAEREPELTFDPLYLVRATGFGPWAGESTVDAVSRIRGELGQPHLPYLPTLAQRGFAATTLARTIACLEGLSADGTAEGWRIRQGQAKESRVARLSLASDINALADVAGKESAPGKEFKIQLMGPVSLAASLRVHSGERALSDPGARRDIRDSLLAGLERWVGMLREALPGESLVLQLNEPELIAAAYGSIKTSSGFRTLGALNPQELEETFDITYRALREHCDSVVLAESHLPRLKEAGLGRAVEVFDGYAYLLSDFRAQTWESIAADVEAEKTIMLRAVDPLYRRQVGELARQIWQNWRSVGLPAANLPRLLLTEKSGLEKLQPSQATGLLGHLTETARALAEIAQEN